MFLDSDTGKSWATGCMEFELPVPRPPIKEFANMEAMKTITNHPELFKITMPIKVDVLEKYLETHPNQPFVQSVIVALQEGFWLWADMHHDEGFPVTWDNGRMSPRSEMEQKFICGYRDDEIAVGHFSALFGPDLLPGMYSTLVHMVPKPHSDDFRMVSNMSAGDYAPNQMICHADIAGSRLNSLHTLFTAILRFR